jgi:hypothetical protein
MHVRKGMFGPIHVVKRDEVQALLLNSQVQGSAFLEPSAKIVDPRLDGPGPVASSPYTYGWLLAGVEQPYGSGVMIGLGSGVGAIQLLYNFPQFDLTVVEIDPVMAEVALRNFPLLEHYLDQGRLNIVIADANEYLRTADHFQIGFADGYDGGASFQLVTSYLSKLCVKCDDVIINVIDDPLARHMAAVAEVCAEGGHPIQYAMKAVPPEVTQALPKANYILTSQALTLRNVDAFIPFANLTDPAAEYGRACWNSMIGSSLQVGS